MNRGDETATPCRVTAETYSNGAKITVASICLIDPPVGAIELFSINSNGDSFACSFLHGSELWKAVFSYDGDVRLEALELL